MKLNKYLIAVLWLSSMAFGQGGTTSSDIYPAVTGQNLGNSSQRWNLYGQNFDINGSFNCSGTGCPPSATLPNTWTQLQTFTGGIVANAATVTALGSSTLTSPFVNGLQWVSNPSGDAGANLTAVFAGLSDPLTPVSLTALSTDNWASTTPIIVPNSGRLKGFGRTITYSGDLGVHYWAIGVTAGSSTINLQQPSGCTGIVQGQYVTSEYFAQGTTVSTVNCGAMTAVLSANATANATTFPSGATTVAKMDFWTQAAMQIAGNGGSTDGGHIELLTIKASTGRTITSFDAPSAGLQTIHGSFGPLPATGQPVYIRDTETQSNFVLTSVAVDAGGHAVYTGTVTGCTNGYELTGRRITVLGFVTNSNNGGSLVISCTATTITTSNRNASGETHAANAYYIANNGQYFVQAGSTTSALIINNAFGAAETTSTTFTATLSTSPGAPCIFGGPYSGSVGSGTQVNLDSVKCTGFGSGYSYGANAYNARFWNVHFNSNMNGIAAMANAEMDHLYGAEMANNYERGFWGSAGGQWDWQGGSGDYNDQVAGSDFGGISLLMSKVWKEQKYLPMYTISPTLTHFSDDAGVIVVNTTATGKSFGSVYSVSGSGVILSITDQRYSSPAAPSFWVGMPDGATFNLRFQGNVNLGPGNTSPGAILPPAENVVLNAQYGNIDFGTANRIWRGMIDSKFASLLAPSADNSTGEVCLGEIGANFTVVTNTHVVGPCFIASGLNTTPTGYLGFNTNRTILNWDNTGKVWTQGLGGTLNVQMDDGAGNSYIKGIASAASQTVVSSATTIAPTKQFFHVSGTTAIVTITAPTGCTTANTMCQITIIPDGAFTTTNAGNIAIASTAVVSKALIMTYDPTTSKWYPSY